MEFYEKLFSPKKHVFANAHTFLNSNCLEMNFQVVADPVDQTPLPDIVDPVVLPNLHGAQEWMISNLRISGMVDYQHSLNHRHYIRAWTRRICAYLTAQFKQFIELLPFFGVWQQEKEPVRIPCAEVRGSCGVGKSTEVWAWLQLQAGHERLWIHCPFKDSVEIIVVRITAAGEYSTASLTSDNICELDRENPRIIVLDGEFNRADIHYYYHKAFLRKTLFMVQCTSQQFGTLKCALASKFDGGGRNLVEGFELTDFIAAESLLHPMRTENDIKEVHYFAGGSARHYFQYFDDPQLLARYLSDLVDRIPNRELQSGIQFVGQASDDYSLVTCRPTNNYRRKTRRILVSKFVRRLLAVERTLPRDFIDDSLNDLPDIELDFFNRVREQRAGGFPFQLKGVGVVAAAAPILIHCKISMLFDFTTLNNLQPVTVDEANEDYAVMFIPTAYYTEGYDAILVRFGHAVNGRRQPIIDILQLTTALHHSKQLQSTADFLERLFPHGSNLFSAPIVRYRIVTHKAMVNAFDMALGVREGLESVVHFDPHFAFPDSFTACYFDGDIPFLQAPIIITREQQPAIVGAQHHPNPVVVEEQAGGRASRPRVGGR